MEPKVSLSPQLEEDEDGEKVLKLGHTLSEDTVTRTLELKNDTELAVRFEIEMESLLPKHKRKKRPNTFSELKQNVTPQTLADFHFWFPIFTQELLIIGLPLHLTSNQYPAKLMLTL